MFIRITNLSLCLSLLVGAAGCSVQSPIPLTPVVEVNRRPCNPELGKEFEAFLNDHRSGWSPCGPVARDNYVLIKNETGKPYSIGYRGSYLIRDTGNKFAKKPASPADIARFDALTSRAAMAPPYFPPSPPPAPAQPSTTPSPAPVSSNPVAPSPAPVTSPSPPSKPKVTGAPPAPTPPKVEDTPTIPTPPSDPVIPEAPVPAAPSTPPAPTPPTPETPAPPPPPVPDASQPPVPPSPSDGLVIPSPPPVE